MKNPNQTNPNEPINPYDSNDEFHTAEKERHGHITRGLTKREYFASMALQAIISKTPATYISKKEKENPDVKEFFKDVHDRAASVAIQYADALIEQLNTIPVFNEKEIS